MNHSPDFRPVILAVDDCHITQSLIQKILEDQYRVRLADEALDALDILHNDNVELMLLDVQMPGIDGLELCRAIRNIPKFTTLPIVMLTSCDHNFDKVRGKLAGATEYLTKPFNPQTLLQVIARYVHDEPIEPPKELSLCD